LVIPYLRRAPAVWQIGRTRRARGRRGNSA
jgi:hypothetical protein